MSQTRKSDERQRQVVSMASSFCAARRADGILSLPEVRGVGCDVGVIAGAVVGIGVGAIGSEKSPK